MSIVVYLNPWKVRRDKERQRIEELRRRDGDNCRRCRRPMHFDLPHGHDQAPRIQNISPRSNDGAVALEDWCLCHGRCNPEPGDATAEVMERIRLKASEVTPRPKRRSTKRARA
jgi:hypothetical protein